ncbi:MAG: hypothetical protein OJF51_000324 [Nitrospira sp.]|jgi:hypothetical protein|nr:MAG: hypothetical protein OJF51_000320 [Nitrospira sp.]WHZ25529.1 MAG: hypothetical protein OJF51_000324 [Nitrospira sp.]
MTMPGFNAESSLGPTTSSYQGKVSSYIWGGDNVMPQFRLGSVGDPDIGAYLRCRANGGSDLICRFFAGLPPFTIGGILR